MFTEFLEPFLRPLSRNNVGGKAGPDGLHGNSIDVGREADQPTGLRVAKSCPDIRLHHLDYI